jgi:hypothetical protein
MEDTMLTYYGDRGNVFALAESVIQARRDGQNIPKGLRKSIEQLLYQGSESLDNERVIFSLPRRRVDHDVHDMLKLDEVLEALDPQAYALEKLRSSLVKLPRKR